MSTPDPKHSAALIDAGPYKASTGSVTSTSDSTSEVLPSILPSNVPEMAVQNPESVQMPQEPQKPFRLMDLPLEIRTMIFKELLVTTGPIVFINHVYVTSGHKAVNHIHLPRAFAYMGTGDASSFGFINVDEKLQTQHECLNIFSTSKAIYRETVPIYFGLNTFYFDNMNYFEEFLAKIGADYRWQLARVRIRYYGSSPARAIKPIASCVGLRELTLDIEPNSTVSTSKQLAPAEMQIFGMKHLLRLRGLKKLELKAPTHLYNGAHYPLDQVALQEFMTSLEARLQVLKQPIDPKFIKRLDKKDFPVKKMRTVFGAANVVTRYVSSHIEIGDMTHKSVTGTRAKRWLHRRGQLPPKEMSETAWRRYPRSNIFFRSLAVRGALLMEL